MEIVIKNSKGVTLIELIITLAIVGIVILLIAPLFFTGINFFSDSNAMVMDQVNLRRMMSDISREIRDASEVSINSDTEIVVDECVYTFNSDDQQITKYFSDVETTVVVSSRVEEFHVTRTDSIIELRIKGLGNGSTIITKIYVRSRIEPTPEIA